MEPRWPLKSRSQVRRMRKQLVRHHTKPFPKPFAPAKLLPDPQFFSLWQLVAFPVFPFDAQDSFLHHSSSVSFTNTLFHHGLVFLLLIMYFPGPYLSATLFCAINPPFYTYSFSLLYYFLASSVLQFVTIYRFLLELHHLPALQFFFFHSSMFSSHSLIRVHICWQVCGPADTSNTLSTSGQQTQPS